MTLLTSTRRGLGSISVGSATAFVLSKTIVLNSNAATTSVGILVSSAKGLTLTGANGSATVGSVSLGAKVVAIPSVTANGKAGFYFRGDRGVGSAGSFILGAKVKALPAVTGTTAVGTLVKSGNAYRIIGNPGVSVAGNFVPVLAHADPTVAATTSIGTFEKVNTKAMPAVAGTATVGRLFTGPSSASATGQVGRFFTGAPTVSATGQAGSFVGLSGNSGFTSDFTSDFVH